MEETLSASHLLSFTIYAEMRALQMIQERKAKMFTPRGFHFPREREATDTGSHRTDCKGVLSHTDIGARQKDKNVSGNNLAIVL